MPEDCRLIIVEGIVGSGKSQTTQRLANFLRRQRWQVLPFNEASWPHPTRVITDLHSPLAPWQELTATELAHWSQRKWKQFAAEQETAENITILDGQFFHGDMSSLLLMGMPEKEIEDYITGVERIIRKLNPLLIYLDVGDVARSLKRTLALRDPQWRDLQLNWKMNSPYCRHRGYTGLPGYIQFYRDYQKLCHKLLAILPITRQVYSTAEQKWPQIIEHIEKSALHHLQQND